MKNLAAFVESLAPGQIWSGSDKECDGTHSGYVLFPLRWEDDPTGGDSLLVVEVFRRGEHFEAWSSLEDLFCDFPGARRLV